MTSKNFALIEKLKREHEQTRQELEFLQQMLKSEVDLELDEADPGVVEREVTTAVIEDVNRKLKEIEHALRQLERGSYGICERCGQPIDPERLEAIPETTLCISCKMAIEKQQFKPGHYSGWRD